MDGIYYNDNPGLPFDAARLTDNILILLGGSTAKKVLFDEHLKYLGFHHIHIMHLSSDTVMHRADCRASPSSVCPIDAVVSRISSQFNVMGIVPLIDSIVPCVDRISKLCGLVSNSHHNALFRCDKQIMQQRLAECGLNNIPSFRGCSIDEALVIRKARFHDAPVVVKPPRSGGSEGVRVCYTEDDIICHFTKFLGARNLEHLENSDLVIQEFLFTHDTEIIVNTVSLTGNHFVTDIWRSDSKSGKPFFVYSSQHLVLPNDPIVSCILEYTFSVLDALGMESGASHIEIAGKRDPLSNSLRELVLIEINPRIAGEIRTCNTSIPGWKHYDQIYWLVMSLVDPVRFANSTSVYNTGVPMDICHPCTEVVAVFLNNFHVSGPKRLNAKILWHIRNELESFSRFGRGLTWVNSIKSLKGLIENRNKLYAPQTVDLITSPGVVLLVGESTKRDMAIIRSFESRSLYI